MQLSLFFVVLSFGVTQAAILRNRGLPEVETPKVPDAPKAPEMPEGDAPEMPKGPDAKVPEAKVPEVETPDVPEAKVPEAKVPEVETPDTPKVPEAKVPEAKVPEAKVPEAKVPEVETPDAPKVPEAKVPEAKVPEAKVPEAKVPEVETPDAPKVPEADTPEVPEAKVPEVPEADTPEVPEAKVPEVEKPKAPEVDVNPSDPNVKCGPVKPYSEHEPFEPDVNDAMEMCQACKIRACNANLPMPGDGGKACRCQYSKVGTTYQTDCKPPFADGVKSVGDWNNCPGGVRNCEELKGQCVSATFKMDSAPKPEAPWSGATAKSMLSLAALTLFYLQ